MFQRTVDFYLDEKLSFLLEVKLNVSPYGPINFLGMIFLCLRFEGPYLFSFSFLWVGWGGGGWYSKVYVLVQLAIMQQLI